MSRDRSGLNNLGLALMTVGAGVAIAVWLAKFTSSAVPWWPVIVGLLAFIIGLALAVSTIGRKSSSSESSVDQKEDKIVQPDNRGNVSTDKSSSIVVFPWRLLSQGQQKAHSSRAGVVDKDNQPPTLGSVSPISNGGDFYARASLLIRHYDHFEEAPSLPPEINEDSTLEWKLNLISWMQGTEKLLNDAINLAEDRDSKEYPSIDLAQNIANAQAGLRWVRDQTGQFEDLPDSTLFINTSRSLIEDVSKIVAFAVGA